MSWWTDRKTLKHAREFVAGVRKLLRINRDLLNPDAVREIAAACDGLAEAIRTRDVAVVAAVREKLERKLDQTLPHQSQPALRENVEVLLVALIVAMAIRSFFVQPFKIPTGSMQPTLYGVYPSRPPWSMNYEPALPYVHGQPSSIEKLLGVALLGRIYDADGYRARGDHIFVDRFTYHFRKPHAGEVIVFDTGDITDLPESSRGKFYIKRLIGLPGQKIEIHPGEPYLYVNGSILDSRPAFKKIYSLENGYHGYELPNADVNYATPPKYLNTRRTEYVIPPHHLFVLGDNTRSSLDGRFWGSLPEKALIGRAILVYWPFTKRFGPVD